MDDQHQSGPVSDDLVWMPSREAARVFGVEPRTIRKWRAAGKLEGKQLNGMWYMGVPRKDLADSGVDIEDLESQHGEVGDGFPTGTMVLRAHGTEADPGPVDLSPMAELIADLTRQALEAQAAAAMYQERSSQLESRLNSTTLALESGKVEASETERRLEDEKRQAIETARQEAAAERDAEWRQKSWWQRLKGE